MTAKPGGPDSKFATLDEAAAAFGVCRKTFHRQYKRYFTDHRPPHYVRGGPNKISRVELRIACDEGWAALADYRARMGLTPPSKRAKR